MKAFLIIFAIALLFVIGSAGMLRYFDRKHIKKLNKNNKNDSEN